MAGPALRQHAFLVTGGTGFLGTHTIAALREAGARVRALDYRPPLGATESDVEYVTCDLRDGAAVGAACAGVEGVFHLAALPSIARGRQATYEAINVGGTRNVLSAAYEHGVRKMVYVSSSTVYGVPDHCPLREDDPLVPRGPYSRTKLAAEGLCAEFVQRGMACSIIRPRVIIGPGRLGIFSLLFERIRRGLPVFILGRGRNRFQFTHVRDVVGGCLSAMEHSGSEVFNLGTEDIPGVRVELSALIRHAGSRSRIVPLPAGMCRAGLRMLSWFGIAPLVAEQFRIADKDFVLDVHKAKQMLGWRPTAGNVACLTEAYDWYVEHRRSAASAIDAARLIRGKHSDVQGGFQASGPELA